MLSVIPDGVHAEARLWCSNPCNTGEVLILPAVDLQPTFLIIRDRYPLVCPRARCNRITVSTTRRCRIQADLALNGAGIRELEGGHIACQVEGVGTGRGKEILARRRKHADISAVLCPPIGDTWRNQRVVLVGVNWKTSCWIDEVLANSVALLHKSIEVVSSRMHGYPSRVVSSIRTIDRTN